MVDLSDLARQAAKVLHVQCKRMEILMLRFQ